MSGEIGSPGQLERVADLLALPASKVISEAYAQAHGARRPSPAMIDQWLSAYTEHGEVPEWLAAFCETVRRRHAAGVRNPGALMDDQGPRLTPMRGLVWFALICCIVIILFAAAQISSQSMGLGHCVLPPCTGR
ncbi:hypothetical protein J2T57_000207 [Natronocella acetinitrilica]|jgi:hypothetical protein|uniref:Uncharacterized protein n=1 Tax=Natronocella acetinitrilica TaxID=414046 RepID=A0AAE3K9T9_9GAMM|nr:hypothetical protein [Natronocella acetinitrilica]MCP1673115.1 hypothetical protein [Natronocella acetinitrilica]